MDKNASPKTDKIPQTSPETPLYDVYPIGRKVLSPLAVSHSGDL